MLKHASGNLLDLAEQGAFDIIVQGCNCFNTMGGGIAREIASRYPQALLADEQTVKGDYSKLGNYTVAHANVHDFDIVNAYTQYNMSTGEDVFEYEAFQLILQKLLYFYGDKNIGFPYIGMGLAGGDKQRIISKLEWFADQVSAQGGSVTLVEFQK